MIFVDNAPVMLSELLEALEDPFQRELLQKMEDSAARYAFPSKEALLFELSLRQEIVRAARELSRLPFAFAVFRDVRANPAFWEVTAEGGMRVLPQVSPYTAIRNIYEEPRLYATECATAMVIVTLKALTEVFSQDQFDRMFPSITLMNWHYLPPLLRSIGIPRAVAEFLPGDRLYFRNPEVDPAMAHLQGENVIDLGEGLFYGHGMGIHDAEWFVEALNRVRREDATVSAYLMDTAARPDFVRLYQQSLRTG